MAISTRFKESYVISVHREPKPLFVDLPTVKPGRYLIPGVAAADDYFEPCIFSFPNRKPIKYAEKMKDSKGHEFVLLRVQDAKTYVAEASEESKPRDEYGKLLIPPIGRHGLDVPSEEVANEIERQFTYKDDDTQLVQSIGILAVEGKEPTPEEWAEVNQRRHNLMAAIVNETNKQFKIFGGRSVTEQARRFASELHDTKRLAVLPEWAAQQVISGTDEHQMACKVCGAVMAKNAIKCPVCPAIYNWKEAVAWGYVKPSDVPPARRKEAGLEMEPVGAK